jgi:hypothetical protein
LVFASSSVISPLRFRYRFVILTRLPGSHINGLDTLLANEVVHLDSQLWMQPGRLKESIVKFKVPCVALGANHDPLLENTDRILEKIDGRFGVGGLGAFLTWSR